MIWLGISQNTWSAGKEGGGGAVYDHLFAVLPQRFFPFALDSKFNMLSGKYCSALKNKKQKQNKKQNKDKQQKTKNKKTQKEKTKKTKNA